MKDWGILFYNFAEKFALVLLVITMVIGAIKYRTFTKELKWFFCYLGFDLIIEVLSRILIYMGHQNLIIYPFYISGEFILLATMIIVGLKLPQKWFIPAGLITVYLLLEPLILWGYNYNSSGIGKTISNMIIVCMIGYYFIHTLKTFENNKTNKILLIYGFLFLTYTSSIFLFLMIDQLATMSLSNASLVWGMNVTLSCLLYGVSSYTFIKS